MPRYAEQTAVSTEKSKAEIERLLERYGADQFMYGWDQSQAVIAFRMQGRQIRLRLPLPDKNADEFRYTPSRRWERDERAHLEAWEQACRQRWRALALVIKAKLEAIEAGISDMDAEFLSQVMLPDGRTVGEWVEPQLEDVYTRGDMPRLLPGAGETPALPSPR